MVDYDYLKENTAVRCTFMK